MMVFVAGATGHGPAPGCSEAEYCNRPLLAGTAALEREAACSKADYCNRQLLAERRRSLDIPVACAMAPHFDETSEITQQGPTRPHGEGGRPAAVSTSRWWD